MAWSRPETEQPPPDPGWGLFYAPAMTGMTIRIQGDPTRAAVFMIAPSGTVTCADRAIVEQDITVMVRALTADGRDELAGRVQSWWWTSGAA